jgi:hypothetical protein
MAFHNKAVVYDLSFKTAAETLTTIAADPKHLGARIGDVTLRLSHCLMCGAPRSATVRRDGA